MEHLLACHTGRSVDTIRADTDRALVLAGEAAVTYGVADVVPAANSGGQLEAGRALTPELA
jgi:ATP-dependent Clp protease protease subunit